MGNYDIIYIYTWLIMLVRCWLIMIWFVVLNIFSIIYGLILPID